MLSVATIRLMQDFEADAIDFTDSLIAEVSSIMFWFKVLVHGASEVLVKESGEVSLWAMG